MVADDDDKENAVPRAAAKKRVETKLAAGLAGLAAKSFERRLGAVRSIRELVALEHEPPIDAVVEAGAVPRLVDLLAEPGLELEAAWALTNVASGTSAQTATVVEAGAVPGFVALLKSDDAEVREQAAWALGNIAGDSAANRDLVLEHGALEALVRATEAARDQRTACWALSNCLRHKPPPAVDVEAALRVAARLVCADDPLVVNEACWTLVYLTDAGSSPPAHVTKRLVDVVEQGRPAALPALLTLGNQIATDASERTQALVVAGLPTLCGLLADREFRVEVLWILANLLYGDSTRQAALDARIVPDLVAVLGDDDDNARVEAARALSNATFGTPDQIRAIVAQGALPPLCELLAADPASDLARLALTALDNLLQFGEDDATACHRGHSRIVTLVVRADGLKHLEKLAGISAAGGCPAARSTAKSAARLLKLYFY